MGGGEIGLICAVALVGTLVFKVGGSLADHVPVWAFVLLLLAGLGGLNWALWEPHGPPGWLTVADAIVLFAVVGSEW